MIAIVNRLPVAEGAADEVVRRFAGSRGYVQDFPGFVSMEVLRSETGDEVLVITRWRDREAFDSWVGSEEFKKAHGRSGGDLLSGHPKMNSYEVAVEREAGARSSSPDQARSANL
ncbi:MAG: antibiotic biosynthesis monooxygenase family protein [Rubrobacteraceae bacterium]